MVQALSHITDLPVPKKISWWWLGGSLLGFILCFQVVSGYILSCYFVADSKIAFFRVDLINRDINFGRILRHFHIFGASMFFFVVYLHMGRGIYYLSFLKNLKVWISGVIIYLLLIVTSFVGYVLPWAQMSFWAATVITNFITVIPFFGFSLVTWVWGSFSVDYTNLVRFYTLHFILPSILIILSLAHIFLLHRTGSSRPLGVVKAYQRFRSFSVVKDCLGIFLIFFRVFALYLLNFMVVSDSEQYIEANPFVTPIHIVPEWYFLPAYAILRSVPKKLGGVVLLILFIVILLIYPFFVSSNFQLNSFIVNCLIFWIWITNFFLLIYLGGCVAEQPFIFFSQMCTFVYFRYFFLLSVIKWK